MKGYSDEYVIDRMDECIDAADFILRCDIAFVNDQFRRMLEAFVEDCQNCIDDINEENARTPNNEPDGMSIAKDKKVEEWLEKYRESHC